MLPMVPAVYAALKARKRGSVGKTATMVCCSLLPHAKAISEGHCQRSAQERAIVHSEREGEESREAGAEAPFQLLHPLTHRTDSACACGLRCVHTLAVIAGHTPSTITQRDIYIPKRTDRVGIPDADHFRAESSYSVPSEAEKKGIAKCQGGHKIGHRYKKVAEFRIRLKLLVRKGGLEPPWVSPPDPKSGASANSATFAQARYRLRLL